MVFRETFLKELEAEAPLTRRHLERVPFAEFGWKPQEKSMTLGWLATFVAILPAWGVATIQEEEFDAAAGAERPRIAASSEELLFLFDTNFGKLCAALATATDAHLREPWTLRNGDTVWFRQPRWLVLREYVLNHLVHHRAQLGVYLRMRGLFVPAVYNDSGDEKGGVFRDVSTPGAVEPSPQGERRNAVR